MSFPHRTWFYVKEKNRIMRFSRYETKIFCVDGRVVQLKMHRNYKKKDDESMELSVHLQRHCLQEVIPLASTGLEDSEGNEIIEGHIVQYTFSSPRTTTYGTVAVTWSDNVCGFYPFYQEGEWRGDVTLRQPIMGHVLTDPEMEPDHFDTAKYFGLEDDEDAEHR